MRPRRPFPTCHPESRRSAGPERLALAIVAAWLARWRHLNLRVSLLHIGRVDRASSMDTRRVDMVASASEHIRCKKPCPLRARSEHRRHSVTSSARASSVGETSRPSPRAVFKLMAKVTFVDCSTGRSAGFSPLSMRSTYPAARRY